MSSYQESSSQQSLSKPYSRSRNHHKRYSTSSIQSNPDSESSFDESKCLNENKPLLNYFNQKSCQICRNSSNGSDMYLCDKCEDGYHITCLKVNDRKLPDTWICPTCLKQEKQAKIILQDKELQIIEEESTDCVKCRKPLNQKKSEEIYFGYQPKKMFFQFENEDETQKCLYCKKLYHFQCFNIRNNALNCSKCEKQIRRRCPKGHKHFLEYYQNKYQIFRKQKYLTLAPLPNKFCPSKNFRQKKQSFKLPAPVTNWLLITQYESSIYYAFQTKKINFIEDQIYNNQNIMEMNRWDRDSVHILELNEEDQRVFQIFKQNTRNGVIVGPYEIKENKVKGFHIVATDFIEKMTIITEYVGEVVPSRKSLFHHNQNDSVFMLIKNPRSALSLDIVPHDFGNIARFFSGINNQNKESRKLLNVAAKRFSYKGRVRIIFYALKNIQAGDELFFDYNGSPFHQYPTEHFKV